MSILNTLGLWQWLVLAAVPPAIILLYFLKLKRMPLEVPSTYLWTRTIEDLHVNSIWQRLRQNLLLFLQLLLILLIILSLLRPGWKGNMDVASRSIFVIDRSASMSATDVEPTRLEVAKQRARKMIQEMKSGDVAMIIAVTDEAQVVQPFTDNARVLIRKLNEIKPTNRTSDIEQALRYAAGLANPGRTSDRDSEVDVQVAEAKPATMYIFSDGGFQSLPDFFLGNLTPKYYPIGTDNPDNVAIGSFTIERNPEKLDQIQAFARLENYGDEDVSVEVSLHVDGELRDAEKLDIKKNGQSSVQFNMDEFEEGELTLTIDRRDDLEVDNKAYVAANLPRRAKIFLVTASNEPLSMAMSTTEAEKYAEVSRAGPAILTNEQYLQRAEAGAYDLIIYDRCAPKDMPQSNTLFIGATPPAKGWTIGEGGRPPIIIDTDRAHPLMQLLDMGNVNIIEAAPVKPPAGGTVLLDSDLGGLIALAPRQGFQDVVVGFDIYSTNENGETEINTDWHIRRSFPVFIMNTIKYLGGARGTMASQDVRPGQPAIVRPRLAVDELRVSSPRGQEQTLRREGENSFVYTYTDGLGFYSVREGNTTDTSQKFTVNLFNQRESNILPEAKLEFPDGSKAEVVKSVERTRKELWKWILIVGFCVLIFEWYVYNRRVYL